MTQNNPHKYNCEHNSPVTALHPTPTDLLNEQEQQNRVFNEVIMLPKSVLEISAQVCWKGEFHSDEFCLMQVPFRQHTIVPM